MGNANRYRKGCRMLIEVPIASATVVEKGDFVFIEGGYATTPSLKFPQGSEGSSAKNCRNVGMQLFGGIAEDASASGDTDNILVDISQQAIYEFVQATAADISIGDRLEITANSTASASWTLADDSVGAGTDNPFAVCVKNHDSAEGTGIMCRLLPQKLLTNASWN